jgi:O-antigen ligase
MKERPLAVFDRVRNGEAADWLVVAVAVSLPWSTSATAILIPFLAVALLASLDVASVRRELMTPAGGLPVLLWGLAAIGMLWADVEWSERFHGLRGYHKLIGIPLLLAHFRRSERVQWVILGFLFSATALLVLSSLTWYLGLARTWEREQVELGVLVKDNLAQSGIFAICALALWGQAIAWWRTGRGRLALVAILMGTAFVANIVYVATARTTLVVVAVLLLLLGFRQFRWRGMLTIGVLAGVLASVSWVSSPYLRIRVTYIIAEVQNYPTSSALTSAGLRLEFWRKSVEFATAAPLLGHGTGTIEALFRHNVTGDAGTAAAVTGNPHNQILAVAIELGVIGALALIAMWFAHLAIFREHKPIAWFGLTIVVGNIISSLFNSHLFDFTQGWLYVFGIGALGGAVLGQKGAEAGTGPQRGARLPPWHFRRTRNQNVAESVLGPSRDVGSSRKVSPF